MSTRAARVKHGGAATTAGLLQARAVRRRVVELSEGPTPIERALAAQPDD